MSPALVALLFHAPGLRVLSDRRLTRSGFALNAVAAGLTVLAMVLAGSWRGAFVAWAVGHAVWSVTLASAVQRLTVERGK